MVTRGFVVVELQPIESFASIAERLGGVFAELDDRE